MQTNPRYREEEPQNIYSNKASIRQYKQSNNLSIPLQDDCKTRMDTKYCMTKQRQTQNSSQTMESTLNRRSTASNLRFITGSSLSHQAALMHLLAPNLRPRLFCCQSAKLFCSHRGYLANTMYHHSETIELK